MRGVSRIRRWLGLRRSGTVILLYHRVANLDSDPQLLSVSPEHFREHLEVLRRHYCPIRLADITDHDPAPREVRIAITFDDGYADNLTQAAPLLRKADWPATVFITAGQLDSDREYWWDDLERIILRSSPLPGRLTLALDGQQRSWRIDDADKSVDPRWNVLRGAYTSRQAVYSELAQSLKQIKVTQRETVIAQLHDWASCSPAGRRSHRSLSREELRSLTADGLIEVGAHTVSHPSLGSISGEEQRNEIFRSKEILEKVLGTPIRSFAYPFGCREDFNDETLRLVREAGYSLACANFPGIATPKADKYQLPRMLVRDWSGAEFAKRLEAIIAG